MSGKESECKSCHFGSELEKEPFCLFTGSPLNEGKKVCIEGPLVLLPQDGAELIHVAQAMAKALTGPELANLINSVEARWRKEGIDFSKPLEEK